MSKQGTFETSEVMARLAADPDMQQLAREDEVAFVLYRRELYLAWVEAQRDMLLGIVRSRFTDVPDEVAALIGQASPDQLTQWAALPFSRDSADAWLRAVQAYDAAP